jgi:hypothetical protein
LRKVFEDAVRDGHFETIEIIFKGREWLWAERKFSAMASLVENYDPSNREHREAAMDLFARVASERRMVRLVRCGRLSFAPLQWKQGAAMDGSASYSSVRNGGIGIRLEKARDAPQRRKQQRCGPWAPPAKVSLTTPSKPVRPEQLATGAKKPVDSWDERGEAAAKAFVAAVLAGDPAKMKDAFYDSEYGKCSKLYEIIREKKTTGWKPCDEEGNLIRWFREALKGYSIDELHAISENLYIEFGGHGWIFDETRETLAFSVSEPILADEMIKTVLDNGDSSAAVKRFEGLFETVGLNHRQRLARMSTLMKTSLSTLHPGQKDRLRQDLDQAPASLAVTALRRLLD